MGLELAQLAPSAGTGIGKLWADVLLRDPTAFAEAMCGVVERGFKAKKRVWDAGAKDWSEEEDCKTQIATLALVLSHLEGDPIKRIVHQHLGIGPTDPVSAIRENPALAAGLEKALANAKFRDRKRKPGTLGGPGPDPAPIEVVPE